MHLFPTGYVNVALRNRCFGQPVHLTNDVCVYSSSQEVAEPLQDLKEGMEQLEKNKTLRYILSTLLAIGNFLNGSNVSHHKCRCTSPYGTVTKRARCTAAEENQNNKQTKNKFNQCVLMSRRKASR